MSDALRGAAETAPIEDVHVSTAAATSRVRRNRALRTGANGLVGVGAAALVVAGIVGAVANQSGVALAERDVPLDEGRNGAEGPAMDAIEPGIASGSMLACGYEFDLSAYPTGAVTAEIALGGVDGGAVQIDVTYSASEGSYTVDVPGVFVIWNGLVVGNPGVKTDGAVTTVTADSPATVSGTTDFVNCWDGAALPAGDYTVVTVTPLTDAATEVPPVEEPSIEPAPLEPSAEPGDPDASVSSDAAGTDGATTDIAVAAPIYAVSEAHDLTVSGEAVENPFDEYLKPIEPITPTGPADALTTDAARQAYEAALAGRWDMAPGTQRVVMTGDALNTTQDMWTETYFGCPMESAGGFPAQSADLAWLDVNASVPSSLSVSYGWVVDGNPLVGFSTTNLSDWSLPGFYQGVSPHLYLVKDGRVVAEAYPVSTDNGTGGGIAYSSDGSGAEGEKANLIYAPENDYLAPGDTRSGEYLWRDLNGCWDGQSQSAVTPGVYTVLSSQDMYIGGSYAVFEDDIAAGTREDEGSDGDSVVAPGIDVGNDAAVDPMPAPDQSDYVSFQVWTSLGTVTVTN